MESIIGCQIRIRFPANLNICPYQPGRVIGGRAEDEVVNVITN